MTSTIGTTGTREGTPGETATAVSFFFFCVRPYAGRSLTAPLRIWAVTSRARDPGRARRTADARRTRTESRHDATGRDDTSRGGTQSRTVPAGGIGSTRRGRRLRSAPKSDNRSALRPDTLRAHDARHKKNGLWSVENSKT